MISKKDLAKIVFLLIALPFVAACAAAIPVEEAEPAANSQEQANDAPSFAATVVDESGAEYTFEQPVERIICLSVDCIDNLYLLGLQPVAVSDVFSLIYANLYADTAQDLPQIATNGGFAPDLEQMISLKPDIVMGQLGITDSFREPLEETGNIQLLLTYPNNVEEIKASLEMVAAITDTQDEAEAVIAHFDSVMAEYQANAPDDVSVLFAYGQPGSDTMFFETVEAQNCGLLDAYDLADCSVALPENAGSFGFLGYVEFTFEAVLAENPDIVLFGGYEAGGQLAPEVLETLNANPLWQEIGAVQEDRVFPIEAWKYSGSNGLALAEIVVGETMALLYPDTFGE